MKQKIQALTIILALPIWGFCQNKFPIGVNANSEISVMKIQYSYSVGGIKEKGGMGVGFSVGIQAQYFLNEKIFLRSGLCYQHIKHRHTMENLIFATDIQNGTKSRLQNNISILSIGIPIDFGYLFKGKNEKINYLIGFGGLRNMHLDTKSKAKIFHEKIDDEKAMQVENEVEESFYSLTIFGGMEWELSKKIILGIEPNIRFTPNKFTLYLYESEARTALETGITVRIRMK
jgi:hypothetical protein